MTAIPFVSPRTQKMASSWMWTSRWHLCVTSWRRTPNWRMATMPWASHRGGSSCKYPRALDLKCVDVIPTLDCGEFSSPICPTMPQHNYEIVHTESMLHFSPTPRDLIWFLKIILACHFLKKACKGYILSCLMGHTCHVVVLALKNPRVPSWRIYTFFLSLSSLYRSLTHIHTHMRTHRHTVTLADTHIYRHTHTYIHTHTLTNISKLILSFLLPVWLRRAVAQRCPSPPMKNLISVGGQHQGHFLFYLLIFSSVPLSLSPALSVGPCS